MTPGADRTRCQYATFIVGAQYLGVEVLGVQEVLRDQRLTKVPLAPDSVAGLINLRGQIVPAIEMRRLMQLEPRDPDATTFSVVVRTEHGAVSLQVDGIGDVIELGADSFEPPPQNLNPELRTFLRGVHKITEKNNAGTRDRLLLVLDKQRAVDVGGAE